MNARHAGLAGLVVASQVALALLLGACATPDGDDGVRSGEALSGARVATLSFGSNMAEGPRMTGALAAGGKLVLRYDADRTKDPVSGLYTCENQHDGYEAWGIRAGVRFLPSGTVIESEATRVYAGDPADLHRMKALTPELGIPAGTTAVEVWFHSQAGAQSQCDAYDSRGGANYRFDVAGRAPVELVYAVADNSGCSSCVSSRGVIDVANVGYEKQVELVYDTPYGKQTKPAYYLGSSSPGRDLFAFENFQTVGAHFAVHYRAAGIDATDDADGNKYNVGIVDGAPVNDVRDALGVTRDLAVFAASDCGGDHNLDSVCLRTAVRARGANGSTDKAVRVVYTTDGWKTWKTAPGWFLTASSGGIERWAANITGLESAVDLSFAVVAERAGSTSWDNAGGANFHCIKRQSRLYQDWTCTGGGLMGVLVR